MCVLAAQDDGTEVHEAEYIHKVGSEPSQLVAVPESTNRPWLTTYTGCCFGFFQEGKWTFWIRVGQAGKQERGGMGKYANVAR